MALAIRDSHFDVLFWRRLFGEIADRWLPVEEFVDGNTLVLRAEMPGIDPDKDLDLTIADDVLTITAHREKKKEGKRKDSYRSEFQFGSFVGNLALPAGAKADDIKACYRDGVLEVRVLVSETSAADVTRVPVARG
jgi:HSP20 family protein